MDSRAIQFGVFRLAIVCVLLAILNLSRSSAASLTELHGFSTAPWPEPGIVLGPDGALYGAIEWGGDYGLGSLFRVTTNGDYETLLSFNGTNGAEPQSGLILGEDGNLYGTTSDGNGPLQNGFMSPNGSIFRLTTNGVITPLAVAPRLSISPANLVRSPDGTLFCSSYGGVFRLTTDGVLTRILTAQDTNGLDFSEGFALGDDGNLYGTTQAGGDFGVGTIFKLTPNGDFSVLHSFDGTNGSYPVCGLVKGPDGSFYGATPGYALSHQPGTIFRFTTAGAFSNVFLLPSNSLSSEEYPCVMDPAGTIYGTAPSINVTGASTDESVNGFVFRLSADGDYSVLATFDGTNGANPSAAMVRDAAGNLYGTTGSGGQGGVGTVFRLATNGDLSALASFDATGGYTPNALVQGADGNLYGMTGQGGMGGGAGIAFKVTTSGAFAKLGDFSETNGGAVAAKPSGHLVEAGDGFYGLQNTGIFQLGHDGALTNYPFNWNGGLSYPGLLRDTNGQIYGIGANGFAKIFTFLPGGAPAVLVSTNDTNIDVPISLLQGAYGTLYGVASGTGGSNSVFQCTTDGIAATMASFPATNVPFQLAMGLDGNLYGMAAFVTNELGPLPPTPLRADFALSDGFVFFRVTPGGVVSNLAYLNVNSYDYPAGELVSASDGNFYCLSPAGRLFQVTTNGTVTELPFNDPSLLRFPDTPISPDPGQAPPTSLLQGADGDLYGTFPNNGTRGGGFVFRYTLRPTVQATIGKNGSLDFTWDAVPARQYQLQSSFSLSLPNWNNVGSPLSTSNYTVSTSDTTGPSSRYYRVVQLP